MPRLGCVSCPLSYWKEIEKRSADRSAGSYSKIQTWRPASMLLQPGPLLTRHDQGPRITWVTPSSSVTSHPWHVMLRGTVRTRLWCWSHENNACFPSKWKLAVLGPILDSTPLLSVSPGLGKVKKYSRKSQIPKCDLRKPVSVAQHSLLSVRQTLLAVSLWYPQQNVF